VIGKKAVDQFAEGVSVKKRGADHAKLDRREDAFVEQRFLDDGQGQPAGIRKSVSQRDGDHHAHAMLPVGAVDGGAVADLWLVAAGCE
jgi:hypothetical protein